MTLSSKHKKKVVRKKIFYIAIEPSMILPDEPDQPDQGFEHGQADQVDACLAA